LIRLVVFAVIQSQFCLIVFEDYGSQNCDEDMRITRLRLPPSSGQAVPRPKENRPGTRLV